MLATKTQIRLDENSRIPKYLQIVNSIIEDIEIQQLAVGDKIPSINEISEEYYLSRDTVEKAYNLLKEKKIIVSVKGKGYYVARTVSQNKETVLFLMNKLSNYKLRIYNSFIDSLGSSTRVDLRIYHCDPKLLRCTLEENAGAYDHFVIMPHFKEEGKGHYTLDSTIMEILKKFPPEKLLIMDNYLADFEGDVASIYQDFKHDIYNALCEGIFQLQNYEKLILVYPQETVYPYPREIMQGFQKFCHDFEFDHEILETVYSDMELRPRDAFIVIEENDLVNLVKQVREQNLNLGSDIGIISYNDTPLKELLGITVISTDFRLMGETAAYMIQKQKKESVKNIFNFINRGSV